MRRAAAEDASAPSFTPFEDLCKTRFLWYYDCYCETIRKGKELGYDGKAFKRMPFESAGNNSMDGVFDYAGLERRIQAVKKALDDETRRWETDGAEAAKVETTVSASLKHQFGQVVNRVKNLNMAHHITLEDGNPFVWIITYFGQPTTKLDGGLFRIRLTFSPRFPNEQPRARFETKIFHHLVAKDGTACYTPNPSKREDVWTHIQAIFELLDDEDPTYDPRKLINLEASTLYWDGKELGRKMYNRRLRRSAQESLE